MDPFSRLPWFILRDILSHLPDLPTLHRLYSASHAVATFLQENGTFPDIVEAIITRPMRENGLLPQVQFSIRILVFIWWRILCSDSEDRCPLPRSYSTILEDLKESREYEMKQQNYGTRALQRSTPSIVLCRLLMFMTRLRQITHACFHALIANCMALKIEHLPKNHESYFCIQPVVDRSRRPKGQPYIPVNIGSPTWLEEQRLILAILRVALFFAFRDAASVHGILETDEETLRLLQDYQAGTFWDQIFQRGTYYAQKEQIHTVLLWMSKQAGGEDKIESWISSCPLSEHLSYCCPEFTPMMEERIKTEKSMHGHRYTCGMLCLHFCRNAPRTPLRCVDYSFYRPFGVVFWDEARMDALGFPERKNMSAMWFAWSSILTEEQWEQMMEQQRITPREY